MRRGNVGRTGFCRSLDSGGYDHAVLVDWNRHQAATCAFKSPSCQAVTWVLDPQGVSRFQQDTRRSLERLLGRGNHHNLVRRAMDRPRGPKVGANGIAKCFRTKRIDVVDSAEARASRMAGDEA